MRQKVVFALICMSYLAIFVFLLDAPMKGKALVNAVKNAQLKPNEIQQMMEALIAKGGGSPDDWVMVNK